MGAAVRLLALPSALLCVSFSLGRSVLATDDASLVSSGPYGYLDTVGGGSIGGWAYDPDTSVPVQVHIYVDGVFHQILRADVFRQDLLTANVCPLRSGSCGFRWDYAPNRGFGTGTHTIAAYFIGMDAAGIPDGINPQATGSPVSGTEGCAYLVGSAAAWCNGLPTEGGYFATRQTDNVLVWNDSVMAGISKSFGGGVFQLFKGSSGNVKWGPNLVTEHGGGLIQVSVWGYNGQEQLYERCPGWTGPKVWNPIQAIAANCGWLGTSNDVAISCFVPAEGSTSCGTGPTLYTVHDNMSNFTMNIGTVPMHIEQWATPLTGRLRLKWRLTSSVNAGPSPQEIPAIFTAQGVKDQYFAYVGAQPFTGAAVTQWGPVGGERFVRMRGSGPYAHSAALAVGCNTEGWWGACDATGTHCVTVAAVDPLVTEGALYDNGNFEGYITALGHFQVDIGTREFAIDVFPFKFDEVVTGDGRSVRTIIHQDIATPSGFTSRPLTCGP